MTLSRTHQLTPFQARSQAYSRPPALMAVSLRAPAAGHSMPWQTTLQLPLPSAVTFYLRLVQFNLRDETQEFHFDPFGY